METKDHDGEVLVALDGSRTEGYSQILVLRELMHRIQLKLGLEKPPRVSDRVSLIGGSGMGGIISIFLGKFEMETPAAIEAYERFCNDVYGNESASLTAAKYDWMTFEEVFRAIANDAGFNADEPMEEENPKCKTVVFALNARTVEVQAVRSYKVHSDPNPPFTILQAARATIASPDLFSSVFVGNEPDVKEFVAYFTNPVMLVVEEAGKAFDDTTKVACILSLGSGTKQTKGLPNDPQPGDRMTMLSTIAENREVAHREALSRYRFDEWEDAFSHITRATRNYLQLHANVNSLDRVVDRFVRPIGPTIRDLNRVPAIKAVFPPPPALSNNFIGRSDLVKAILAYHRSPLPKISHRHWTTVLYGIGGIGKTQLAIKIGNELHSQNPDLLVFFLDARSTLNLENGLRQLIRSRDAKFWNKDHEDAILWLSTTKNPWLAILDNADDPEMDLSPYLPTGGGNHVIITSRNPVRRMLAPNSNYEIEKLNPADSSYLLLSASQYPDTDVNRTHTQEITAALHHHPLAIVQAGGYILQNRQLSQYLSILNQKRDQLLSNKHVEQPNYPLTVYASFQLSFDQLPPNTQDILWVLSFLNSAQIDEIILAEAVATSFIREDADIPTIPQLRKQLDHAAQRLKQLFCPSNEWDLDDFSQNISSAIQYSLLTVTETEDEHIFYSIHPLIESFLRDILPANRKELPGLSVRMVGSIITLNATASSLAFNQRLLPHIEAVSSVQSILPLDRYALAVVLWDSGVYTMAERHVIIASAQLKEDEIPLENPFFQRVRTLNGLIWSSMGRQNDTLRIQEEVLQINIKILGEEHPNTIISMNNLAVTLQVQGNYTKAEELGEKVLTICRRVLGEEHPSTLTSMGNLAITLQKQGKYTKAAEMGELELGISRRVLGEEHPSTLSSMGNLALTLHLQGNYTKAAELGEQVLDIKQRVLGEEHPKTLLSMNNLALTLQKKGNYAKAAELDEQVLEIKRRVLGEEHPSTLTSMSNLALILQYQGNYTEAAELGEKVLEISRRVLGEEHSNTLTSMSNLAATLQDQGNYTQAAELGEEAMKIRRRVLGEEHPDTLNSMSNLAATLQCQGNYTRAAVLGEQVLEIQRRVLGEEHPSTLNSMSDLAANLQKQGNYIKSAELGEQVLEISRRVLGDEHPNTLNFMNNLASNLRKQGNYTKTAELEEQVLEIQRRVLGEEHPNTLISMSNLALTLQKTGNYTKAANLGEQVLEIKRRTLGEEHPSTLTSMNNLAANLRKQGDYIKAAEMGEQVLKIRQKVLGEEHPKTLTSMSTLALTLQNQGNYTKSAELGEQAVKISRRVLGEKHPDTLKIMFNMVLTLEALENYTRAVELLTEVTEGCRKVLGGTHPDTISAEEKLAKLLELSSQ